MKLKTIALAALCFAGSTLFAQTLKVEKGPAFTHSTGKLGAMFPNNLQQFYDGKNIYLLGNFGYDKVGFIAHSSIETVSLKKFDLTGKADGDAKIDFKDKIKKSLKSPGFGYFNNNVVCYGLDHPDKKANLYIEFCDLENKLSVKKEIAFEENGFFMRLIQNGHLNHTFVTSANGQYGAVLYTLYYNESDLPPKRSDYIFGVVFDKDLNEVTTFTQKIDKYNQTPYINGAALDGDGNLIALVSNGNTGASLFKFAKGTDNAEVKELPIINKEIDYLRMHATGTGKYNILGFAKNKKGKDGTTNTVYCYSVDKNLELTPQTAKADDLLKLVTTFSNKKQEIGGPGALSGESKTDLQFIDVSEVTTSDNGTVFVFQKQYTTTRSVSGTTTINSSVKHCLDIYAIKLNSAGEIEWTVRKPRYVFNNITVPVGYNKANNTISILYNNGLEDMSTDQNAPSPDRYFTGKEISSEIICLNIDAKGTISLSKTEYDMNIDIKEGYGVERPVPYTCIDGKIILSTKSNNGYHITTFIP